MKTLRPIAEAAAAQGCTIGLYNHGGWFGEPENQLAIIDGARRTPTSASSTTSTTATTTSTASPSLLEKMKPHLYAINLNGTDRDGERRGRKILPLGQGELDLELLRTISESGYDGPIGILGHTQDDAELAPAGQPRRPRLADEATERQAPRQTPNPAHPSPQLNQPPVSRDAAAERTAATLADEDCLTQRRKGAKEENPKYSFGTLINANFIQ